MELFLGSNAMNSLDFCIRMSLFSAAHKEASHKNTGGCVHKGRGSSVVSGSVNILLKE
jgi:hypothetical protein